MAKFTALGSALVWLVLATPVPQAQAGTLVGVYAPPEPTAPRYFAAVYDEGCDHDRQETAITCTLFTSRNGVSAAGDGQWLKCPFLVGSQKLMIGCVGPDGRLRFYVTACCKGNNVCASGYRADAEAVPEFVAPGHDRNFQMGWDSIAIGNFYNSFNIQFRCQTSKPK
jgi:hypothetical protein